MVGVRDYHETSLINIKKVYKTKYGLDSENFELSTSEVKRDVVVTMKLP